jgi:hypothetical protein
MMPFTNKQKQVLAAAQKQIENEEWFSGLSVSSLPSDAQIDKSFEDSVQHVVSATMFWDAPLMKGD